MEGCDDQESVCSSNEREGDAFPKAFERDLVTPTNLQKSHANDSIDTTAATSATATPATSTPVTSANTEITDKTSANETKEEAKSTDNNDGMNEDLRAKCFK